MNDNNKNNEYKRKTNDIFRKDEETQYYRQGFYEFMNFIHNLNKGNPSFIRGLTLEDFKGMFFRIKGKSEKQSYIDGVNDVIEYYNNRGKFYTLENAILDAVYDYTKGSIEKLYVLYSTYINDVIEMDVDNDGWLCIELINGSNIDLK